MKKMTGQKCLALRNLLADGKWHTSIELWKTSGIRFGARVMEVRNGTDGLEPTEIEAKKIPGNTSLWKYRFRPAEKKAGAA